MTEHMMVFGSNIQRTGTTSLELCLDSIMTFQDPYWQLWEVNEEVFDCFRAYYRNGQTENIKTYDLGERCESDTEQIIVNAPRHYLALQELQLEIPFAPSSTMQSL